MDAECFKQQYLPCHEKLYRIAFRLLGNACDAEDMVQEAYLKLWNKRDELAEVKNPESYSVVILKNLCFDFLRSAKDNIDNRAPEDLNIAGETSVATEIEIKDEFNRIKEVIFHLPRQQRQVMILRHVNDCSMEEIEKVTGLNAINIRVLLSRARKKIREQFNRKD